MFKAWLDILQRSPPSTVLWLLRPKGPVGKTVARNLLREAAARGLQLYRLVLAPRVNKFAHLDRLLRERFGVAHVEWLTKSNFSAPAEPHIVEAAAGWQLAVSGLGD